MKRLLYIFLLIFAVSAFGFAQGGIRRAAPMAAAGGGGGGVTFDAATTSSAYVGNTSFSFSHTTSGSDRYLLVALLVPGSGTVTSITYNGVALSLVGTVTETVANGKANLYGLIAPATGANTVLVTVGGPPSEWGAIASSYTGVNQTTAVGTPVSTTVGATSSSVNVSSASNEIVADMVIAYNSVNTVGAGQTSNGNLDTGVAYTVSSSRETGSTTTTMSWSFDSTRFAAQIAVAIKPV